MQGLQSALDSATLANGVGNFDFTVCETVTPSDPFYCGKYPGMMVAQLFLSASTFAAWSAAPDSAAAGDIFFDTNVTIPEPPTSVYAAALLLHESLYIY